MTATKFSHRFADCLSDLEGVLAVVWSSLENADRSPSDPWAMATLGNVAKDVAQQRLLMIRRAARHSATLLLHTDVRSPKVVQLEQDNRISLHLYDWNERVQLVAEGTAKIHRVGELVEREWERTPLSSRRGYLAPYPPGEVSTGPTVNLPAEFSETLPSEDEVSRGFANFSVIECHLNVLDLLILGRNGNTRAMFQRSHDTWQGQWLYP